MHAWKEFLGATFYIYSLEQVLYITFLQIRLQKGYFKICPYYKFSSETILKVTIPTQGRLNYWQPFPRASFLPLLPPVLWRHWSEGRECELKSKLIFKYIKKITCRERGGEDDVNQASMPWRDLREIIGFSHKMIMTS